MMGHVTVIRYIGAGHEGMIDKDVHICTDGSGIAMHETLCGNVDTYMPIEETGEPVTCATCKAIYQDIKLSKKRIKFAV